MITLYECLLKIFEDDEKLDPKQARDDVKSLANDDNTPNDIIHKMFTAGSKKLQEKWSKLCKEKNYTESQGQQLLQVLMKHDLIDLAAACINDRGLVDGDVLLNKHDRFLLGSFLDQKMLDDYKLSRQAIADIIGCQPPNGSTAVGPGEMFLTFIIKDAVQNGGAKKGKNDDVNDKSEITGDIKIGNMGVEIKGSSAAFQGQKQKPSHSELIKNIKKLPKECYYIKSGKSDWQKCWPKLLEYCKTPEGVAKALYTDVYSNTNLFDDYLKMLRDKPSDFEEFNAFMISGSAYSLKQYHSVEPFDSILFLESAGTRKSNPTAFIIRPANLSIREIFDIMIENFTLDCCPDMNSDHRVMPKINLIPIKK